MIKFNNEFEKASYTERLAFKTLIDLHTLDFLKDKNYRIGITSYEGKEKYDVSIKETKNDGMHHHIFIELKIRRLSGSDLEQAEKDGFFYEHKKHLGLMYLKNLIPEYVTIKYINFTPNGVLIWDIDKLIEENKLKVTKRIMNKTTSVYGGKKSKDVYLLKKEWATHYPYYWSDDQFDNHIKELELKEIEELERNKPKKPNIGFDI